MAAYLIIGSGRIAKHIQHYFSLLDISFATWSRKTNTASELPLKLSRCSRVLLLISDDAIFPFFAEHVQSADKIVIHMSGCLASCEGLYSAHPLMTFSHVLYDEHVYKTIPFILDQQQKTFADLFPELSNSHYIISSLDKTLYHAYCVMSGNFTTLLWEEVMTQFKQRWNLPKSILLPYLQQLLNNQMVSTTSVLTGPLVRQDHKTLELHLAALANTEARDLYQAFIEFYNKTRKQP